MSTPAATIKAYRRKGGAVVTVTRPGRPVHRYRVTLRRYHALRQWIAFGKHPWKSSGAWLHSSLNACLWANSTVSAYTEVAKTRSSIQS
jgi:hypothetical protein